MTARIIQFPPRAPAPSPRTRPAIVVLLPIRIDRGSASCGGSSGASGFPPDDGFEAILRSTLNETE